MKKAADWARWKCRAAISYQESSLKRKYLFAGTADILLYDINVNWNRRCSVKNSAKPGKLKHLRFPGFLFHFPKRLLMCTLRLFLTGHRPASGRGSETLCTLPFKKLAPGMASRATMPRYSLFIPARQSIHHTVFGNYISTKKAAHIERLYYIIKKFRF